MDDDGFNLSTSEKQSAFDTSLLALRAIHNEEINSLKKEIEFLKDKIEKLKQDLKKETEEKNRYMASLSKTKKLLDTVREMKAIPVTSSAASLTQSARLSPRGPHTPGRITGTRSTVQINTVTATSATTSSSVSTSLITPNNKSNGSIFTTSAPPPSSSSPTRSIPPKQLFHKNSKNSDDDDDDESSDDDEEEEDDDDEDDTELPLKNVTKHTQNSSPRPKVSTPNSHSTDKSSMTFPQFLSNKKAEKEREREKEKNDEYWGIQMPGMYDSPLKKKPRKTPQKCAGVGVIPYSTDGDDVKILLYEPLDEKNSKKGFLVDFGGPIEGGNDVFESASNILARETNSALYDTNEEFKTCLSVKNDNKGGYVILFFKVKYQDPKNFEASNMSERNRKYRWIPLNGIMEKDMKILKYPLHERMTKANGFYDLLSNLSC